MNYKVVFIINNPVFFKKRLNIEAWEANHGPIRVKTSP